MRHPANLRPYAGLILVVAAVALAWTAEPWQVAVKITVVAVVAAVAGFIASWAETQQLRAWADRQVLDADRDLDALLKIVGAVVGAKSRTPQERQALRELRAAVNRVRTHTPAQGVPR